VSERGSPHGYNPEEPGLSGSSQKSTHIKICKKILTQFGRNPWWVELGLRSNPFWHI